MRDVAIIGTGETKVEEHWDTSLRHLALEAIQAALADAGVARVDALYVGNMLAGELAEQEHVAALVADFAGLSGVEALRVEAADASGAAALRVGYMAVAGGVADIVVVVGVEKMSDAPAARVVYARSLANDGDFEGAMGGSLTAIAALLMRRYMHEYGYTRRDFAPFAVNAHRNGVHNPKAMFRFPITEDKFVAAPPVCDPIGLLDSAPAADGAAAVVLAPAEAARTFSAAPVRILASAVGTDALAVHDRHHPLVLGAASLAVQRAYEQAGVTPQDIDLFELHGSFGILAALSLEAAGFAGPGRGVRLALEGALSLDGRIPIATMGGLKARGHPAGATGVYQVVEVVQQLRGLAGKNQVRDARLGMTQSLGGSGGTAITHILERMD